MKARIRPENRLTNNQKAAIKELAAKELDKQQQDGMRRIFKLFCIVLNEEYGFGKRRLWNLIQAVDALCQEKTSDPVYWTHVDRAIDQIGLAFQPEDYEEMDA